MNFLKKISSFLLIITVLVSCSKFTKLQKSTDLDKKYEMAIQYFEKGDFVKSYMLLEELMPLYRGTTRGENVYYYFTQCTFEQGDYTLAQYYFKNFVKQYRNSVHAEECAYMSAYCYYLNSPTYSLDQSDSKAAIKEFQMFINEHPNSERIKECNEIMDKLREKLERKSYENAKLYYNTGDYKAAVVAFKNAITEFPGCKYNEELAYLIVKANYTLAVNSVESKKAERLKTTVESYFKFVDTYPKSLYLRDAEDIYTDALKQLDKIKPI